MSGQPDPTSEWWTTSDVAAYLGLAVATVSAYRGVRCRIWPQFREAVSPARLGAVAQSSALYRPLSHYGVT
jgi:hypothetical protein